jgi:hypothetical protein
MRLSKHKGKLAIALGACVLVCAVVFWISPEPPPVRLTFVHTTNDLLHGRVGVFRIENRLPEKVTAGVGFYQRVADRGPEPRRGDWGAPVRHSVAAQTTNSFTVWIPTNGGPYRLVLHWLPASKSTAQYYSSVRARAMNWLVGVLNPSSATHRRWTGWIYSVSDGFEASPPDTSPKKR